MTRSNARRRKCQRLRSIRGAACFHLVFIITLIGLMTMVIGCGEESRSAPGASEPDGLKIVCLSPAITQMIIDMGYGDRLVGVAQSDPAAKSDSLGLPVCGNYLSPDIERIVSLEADMVLTESASGELPDGLQDLVEAGVLTVKTIEHARSIGEVGDVLTRPENGLGVILGDMQAAQRVRRLMEARAQAVGAAVADRPRPRVLMLVGTSPLQVLGPGATHHELLAQAGGVNAAASLGRDYAHIDREKLVELRPDVILILSAGAPPLTENDSRLEALQGVPVPAVMNDRIHLLSYAQIQLPTSTLARVIAEMAKAIHPDIAEPIEQAYESAGRLDESPAALEMGG